LCAVTKGRHAAISSKTEGVSHHHRSYHQIHKPWL
jgi:hypothetical protein